MREDVQTQIRPQLSFEKEQKQMHQDRRSLNNGFHIRDNSRPKAIFLNFALYEFDKYFESICSCEINAIFYKLLHSVNRFPHIWSRIYSFAILHTILVAYQRVTFSKQAHCCCLEFGIRFTIRGCSHEKDFCYSISRKKPFIKPSVQNSFFYI